jgi:hypothetical protein
MLDETEATKITMGSKATTATANKAARNVLKNPFIPLYICFVFLPHSHPSGAPKGKNFVRIVQIYGFYHKERLYL